jgi:hypothetical protein
MKNPLIIIVGHYGSGKSEFAVNLALKKNNEYPVCLVDLDIINTYFRSREVREFLNNKGIEVVSDTLNSTKGLDMPYLSPAIKGKILIQYHNDIVDTNYEMWMVVNVFRKETSTAKQIIKMIESLENESGLKITGLINNSNYLKQTTVEDIIYSNQIIKEVVALTNIKVIYTSSIESLIPHLPNDILGDKFPLKIYLREKWL